MKSKWLLFILVSVLRPAFGDELFQYSLVSYPKDPSVGCAATAEALGKRFSAVTGKKVFRATCDASTRFGYDLTVTYVAQATLPRMSTLMESEGSGGRLSVYRSREDCQRNLDREIRWFEESTGLARFNAYCFQDSELSLTPYAAYVDGLGAAKLHPYRFELGVYGNVISSSTWAKNLFDLAQSSGIRIKQVTIAHDGGNKLVARYYDAPENALFHSRYFVLPSVAPFFLKSGAPVAQFYSYQPKQTQQECLFSGEKVLETFDPEFKDRSVWFCTWDPLLFKAALYVVYVKPQSTFEGELVPLRYDSFEQCEAERSEVVKFYKFDLKKEILGGLCTWQSGFGTLKPDGYWLQIFKRVKE